MLTVLAALAAAAQAPPAIQQPPQNDDPVICRREPIPEVGTHMRPKRTCMKKSEWDYVERNTREKLQLLNSRGSNPILPPERGAPAAGE